MLCQVKNHRAIVLILESAWESYIQDVCNGKPQFYENVYLLRSQVK